MEPQQHSAIRYFVLGQKSNRAIQAKLSLVYGRDALCRRTVDTWAARFRSGRISVEDNDRSGRSSSANFPAAVSGYLNRNPHTSCREIAKDLFIPKTSILRVLDEMGLKFFVARWVPYKLSAELKAKRIEICQEVLGILEQIGPRQQNHVITGTSPGFTGIIFTVDNGQQTMLRYLVKFVR
jgi:transposase